MLHLFAAHVIGIRFALTGDFFIGGSFGWRGRDGCEHAHAFALDGRKAGDQFAVVILDPVEFLICRRAFARLLTARIGQRLQLGSDRRNEHRASDQSSFVVVLRFLRVIVREQGRAEHRSERSSVEGNIAGYPSRHCAFGELLRRIAQCRPAQTGQARKRPRRICERLHTAEGQACCLCRGRPALQSGHSCQCVRSDADRTARNGHPGSANTCCQSDRTDRSPRRHEGRRAGADHRATGCLTEGVEQPVE